MEAGVWEGTVALVNRETGEAVSAALMLTVTATEMVYLMQPADRSKPPHLIRGARRQDRPGFLERILMGLRRHCCLTPP